MPRKPSSQEGFNQSKYQQSWDKENMATVLGKYKKDFVVEFKNACKQLGITQSQVIKEAMIATIEKARKGH